MGAARQRETWYPAMHLHAPASSGSPSASFAGDEKPLRMAAVGAAAHFPPAPPGNQPRTPASGGPARESCIPSVRSVPNSPI